ncbi:MAG: glycine cleavage system protein GcvH [Planctomycetales bacterium]|nr:glycine cleavage system protein GcvH [Planctomycetales bacterium]MCA9164317.1 glycine cleavage system protein GcvH [Planctomycetales bacterium]MCA9208253.1 glycine cleavage system protein GcvH [Planctomycetales bacterium]MCA9219441.1 glycine cleavage system protein GcvH [Planctomycetales bacterium]MCA9228696.1 glycine cleavage system protein GcvH [Planctomycetales bacterium]
MAVKPEELIYAETHEWAHVTEEDGAKVATVGISAFAVEQLTDLVYMQLPAVGKQVSAGDEFGEVESVKAVSSLYSPVDGEIVAVNESLPDNLEKLNQDPYGEGWIIKVRLTDESSLSKLLGYEQYQKQCAEEG